MKQNYYVVFSDGLNRDLTTYEFTDNLIIHTVNTYGRNMATLKAVKEAAEHYSMLDMSPLAVFEQREIDMMKYFYYHVTDIYACEWLRYIIENACRDRDAFRAMTRDRSIRRDEHLIYVVSFLVKYAEKHAYEELEEE